MRNRTIVDKVARFFKFIYLKLFRINDSPQKVAMGLGLGVFLGVLPGTGPVAALAAAFIFRANRAAAIFGSILTNTWLSIPVFFLALKVGAAAAGIRYHDLQEQWNIFIRGFRWEQLFSLTVFKVIGPVLIGYFVVSFCIGAASYCAALVASTYFKKKRVRR